jgi:hypothetical protein
VVDCCCEDGAAPEDGEGKPWPGAASIPMVYGDAPMVLLVMLPPCCAVALQGDFCCYNSCLDFCCTKKFSATYVL